MLNPSTHPQNIQLDKPLHGSDAKASLGISNFLMKHLIPQGQPQQGQGQLIQTSNPAPQPPSNQQTTTDTTSQIKGLEGRIMDEIGTLRDEMSKVPDAKKEIADLKLQVQQALNQPDAQQSQT
jgi:hypothetical protein